MATRFCPRPNYTEDAVADTLDFLQENRAAVFAPQFMEAFYYAADIASEQGLPWIFTIHSDDPVYWVVAGAVDLRRPNFLTVGGRSGSLNAVSNSGFPRWSRFHMVLTYRPWWSATAGRRLKLHFQGEWSRSRSGCRS